METIKKLISYITEPQTILYKIFAVCLGVAVMWLIKEKFYDDALLALGFCLVFVAIGW